MQRIPLTSDAVTFHGRIVPEGEGLWLGWTNTGISFRFEGRHVAFRFALPPAGQVPYVGILVDEEPRRMLPVEEGRLTLEIPLHSPGEHRIRLIKMTELLDDISLYLGGVALDDGARLLPPPPLPCRRLEFIGDSMTCGFGNLSAGPRALLPDDGRLHPNLRGADLPPFRCGHPLSLPFRPGNHQRL